MEQLKPCPFCNNKPRLRRYGLYDYAVGCNSDKCNINPRTPVCDTEEGAVELWNDRGKPTTEKKIYKSKCRYCGGDLEMYTHEDRNNVGKEGFTTSLTCRGCAGNLFEFSFTADDISNAEKRLLERYGIKGEWQMREIIFRGKRADNGEWVYGSLITERNMFDGNLMTMHIQDIEEPYDDNLIDDETVGQFTGLTDKNGTKIFEGDILSAHLDDGYPEDITLLEVVWHNNGWYGKNEPFFDDFDNGFEKYFEVIGNIHDKYKIKTV